MAAGNFDKCHSVTGKWEGGWSDHPADPGGKTMYGITLAKYREHFPGATGNDLKNISRETALRIYRSDYWDAVAGERLAPGVDLATYDAAVNSGVGRGQKWLAASVGGPDYETVRRICAKRLGFMQSLAIWKSFGKGWARRVADIEAKGVAWAMGAVTNQQVVKKTLEREAEAAKKTSTKQVGTGTAVGGGGAAVSTETANWLAGTTLAVLIIGAVVVAGVLIWRSRINKHRAEAYAKEAAAR